jgi:hypothetical protein
MTLTSQGFICRIGILTALGGLNKTQSGTWNIATLKYEFSVILPSRPRSRGGKLRPQAGRILLSVHCAGRAVLDGGAGGHGLRGPRRAPAPLATRAPLGRSALRAKTNTSHKRPLCGGAPRPPAPRPPGQSRLCARPAAPAAQAILISVWVCAGSRESKPAFFQRPSPDPRLPGPRGSAYPCWQPRQEEPPGSSVSSSSLPEASYGCSEPQFLHDE